MNKPISPIIALVGQKNVGKSALFNRLTHTNLALISNNGLGLTRDRQYGCVQYKQYRQFIIIDTGGFDRFSNTNIQNYINHQTILAIKESCLVLFIINGREPVSTIEYDIVNYLRKLDKNIFIVVNKIDTTSCNSNTLYDCYSLGIKNIFNISAIHGYGISNLLKQISITISRQFYLYNKNKACVVNIDQDSYCLKNFNNTLYKTDQFIKLAVVGRPNSGKSTFINYVVKKNRLITSLEPGTTRDSIYVPTIYNNQKYILIDTAGIRRKKQILDITAEHISVTKTLQVLKDAHVILFIIDIHAGIVDQDLSLLRLIVNQSQALIVVINKCDNTNLLVIRKNITQLLVTKANFLNNAKIHFISSLYGNGIKNLFTSIKEIYQSSIQTISTAQLTRILHQAVVQCPPPFLLRTRTYPKLKYVHIGGYNPIIIIIHGTQVSKLSNTYKRYLKQYFCRSLNMKGIIIQIRFKDSVNLFKQK